MSAVATRAAVVENLHHLVRGPLTLRLFGNNVTPHRGQTLAEFVECDFPGYTPAPLADWSDSGDDPAVLSHPKCTFRLADDLDTRISVWGWYMTRGDAVVYACRRVDSHGRPARLADAGSVIEVTPTVKE